MSQVLRIEHTHLQSPNVFCNVQNAYETNFRDTIGAVDIMEEIAGCGRAAEICVRCGIPDMCQRYQVKGTFIYEKKFTYFRLGEMVIIMKENISDKRLG